jgi:hypothetical protein
MGNKTQKYCCRVCYRNHPIQREKNRLQSQKRYNADIEKVKKYNREWARKALRKKKGLPLDLPRMMNNSGEGYICKKGYKYFGIKGHPLANKHGRVAEHKLILSNHLGRILKKGETVHHKNGVRHDNRLENLELWSKGQPSGQRVKDKIDWCIEFLSQYGDIQFKPNNIFD